MAQNREGKQSLKAPRRYNAHIDCGDRLSVIAKEMSLRRRLTASIYFETVDEATS